MEQQKADQNKELVRKDKTWNQNQKRERREERNKRASHCLKSISAKKRASAETY